MRRRGAGLLLLIGCAAAAQVFANVSASLNAYQVASGDTVQLTLERDGRSSGQPDVAPLQQDFDILGTSSSTSIELINGSLSEKTDIVLTLAPKVTGQLTIPALSWHGEQTRPLTLTVTGPGSGGQSGTPGAAPAAKVFMEVTATPEQPYVEAAVQLTVRLFMAETLYHADLELPESSDFVVKQVGSDANSDAQRNGQTYQVVTRQYLLFPLHSGRLTVQGPVLDAQVAVSQPQSPFGNGPFSGFFGGSSFGTLRTVRPVRLRGNPVVLSVRPRPAGAGGSYWLPARDVTLSAAWNPAQLSAQAGDPVTLDLDLQATGLTAAQLPDLSSLLSVPAGLKAYPDQAKLSDSSRNGQLVGTRDQTIALMADSPGHYAIPALTVSWWDTETNRPRTAALPARTLTILPAPAGTVSANAAPAASVATAPAAQPQPKTPSSRQASSPPAAQRPAAATAPSEWEWISIGLAVVWLLTLGAWLWSRRSRSAQHPTRSEIRRSQTMPPHPTPTDASKERGAFRAACETNDASAARAHLLAWARTLWGATPAGINAIAARIADSAVAELLRDLDRACYAGGMWQGHALAAALTELPAPLKTAHPRDGLAPLYP